MDISVIIPCRNLEGYIRRCLSSVLSQTYDKKQFEIILVLDSCTDMSLDQAVGALKAGEVSSHIIITDAHNAGLARNIGLETAIGNYIFFIDGDDYLTDREAFEKLKANIVTNNSSAVYMTAFESEDKSVIEAEAIWRFFYRRDIIGKTKFLQAPINEDWLFVKDVRRKPEYKESTLTDVLYHYTHPREGSITAQYETL